MEKLKQKQEKFLKSLHALDRSIRVSLQNDLSYEMMQIYLVQKYAQQQINSPKPIFRQCFALEILDNATIKELLDMSEARNATVHDYDEETAQETCKRIREYYKTLKSLEKLSI